MPMQKDMYPGSKWWKIDFHVHTPASSDYKNKDISEEKFLRTAMESNLDCMVIADHNSGKWIDTLQKKNMEIQRSDIRPQWYRDLFIFPGVEITVANSGSRVHLIAIFDINCDTQKITSVLGACGIADGFGDSQSTSTIKGFIESVALIENYGGIAVPAHIDGENGLLHNTTSLGLDLEKSLGKINAAEFCDIHAFDNVEDRLKNAVKKIAKLGGSDAHNASDIGRFSSWVKMDSPSLAGLRLALMDYEYSVKNQEDNPNHLPDVWFNNLEIQNMKYCGRIPGRAFALALSPGLNAFIGGRGSGKSTLLESIRIASRRDSELTIEAPKTKEKIDRFMSTAKDGAMMQDTKIILELWRYGQHYRLHWRNDQQGNVLEEKTADGQWHNTEPGILQERFSVSIFSQKQIEELASNPRGLLKIIDQSTVVNRNEWNSRWENTKSFFMQLREKQRELIRRISDESQITVKIADLGNNLKQYEAQGHGEILKNYQRRILQKNALPSDDVFNNISANILDLSSAIGLPDFPVHLFDANDDTVSELKTIYERASLSFKGVSEYFVKLAQDIDQIKVEMKQSVANSKWNRSLQSSTEAYTKLMKDYQQRGNQINLSLYDEWTQQYRQLQQQLQDIGGIKLELSDVEKQINDCYTNFFSLRSELFEKRRKFLDTVIGSNPFVRMELTQFGDVNPLEDEYRTILNVEGEAFSSSILDKQDKKGILCELQYWQDNNIPGDKLPELIESVKKITIDIANAQPANIIIDLRYKTRLRDYLEKQPSIFDHLYAWFPEDLLQVKYSKDPFSGSFDNIGSGSPGQKAAAILAFLLSYGDQPLIIDQPEDDLDNALIYDLIVRQIQESKTRRQLIIATHNPNIVVNGDAELTVSLKFSGGQVHMDTAGGLGTYEVRASICTIMEGGREAFDKRYNRITLKR